MSRFAGKRVLYGLGGSIAAYRACDVIRRLKEHGVDVRVAPTRAACAFVTPLTFEALSGRPILGAVLEMQDGKIPHVEEAYAADAVVIAPASADLLAKMAHGIADEALYATLLSVRAPIVVAPAMESRMWDHPATRANVALLKERGIAFVGPVEGPLASGRSGAGRMAAVDDIVEAALAALANKDLAGRRVLVTAGPTVEEIDPVRFISNRSSGKMGVALARAAAQRGATVELVHGPLKLPVPLTPGITATAVRSAEQMHAAVLRLVKACDVAILCAAVADARPKKAATRKLKKGEDKLDVLALEPTPDILAAVGRARGAGGGKGKKPAVLVGFAAETHDVERYAADKLKRKACDLIVANNVAEPGSGFDGDENRVWLQRKDGGIWLDRMSKDAVAHWVLDEIVGLGRKRGKRG